MTRMLLTAFSLSALLPVVAAAQSQDEQIARAVMAAPEAMRADATVITFDDGGAITVVRQGSNGLMCWDSSDEPGQQGRFSSQCTSELNKARVEQNHRIVNSGTPEEAAALFDEAEDNGTRAVAEFGTVYYHLIGDTPETGRVHTNIAVPFATGASLGIPESRRSDGIWIMDAGTSGAHLMMPGM